MFRGHARCVLTLPVLLLALGSATAYAIAANLKHVSAGQVPDAQALTGRSVARFVHATLTHRLYVLSIAVDLTGAALQILALHRGALSVVQPLLVSGLVIALVLRARSGGRVRPGEIAWGAVLAASLAGFLAVARVSQGSAAVVADVRPAAGLGVAGLVLAGLCVLVARRRRGRRGGAAVLGLAVGVIDATVAALLKSLTTVVTVHGVPALLTTWQLYVLVVLVAAAMLLNQMAFQAGPLSASLPVISSVDPLVSVVIGVFVFDESFRHGPVAVVALVALSGVLIAAVAGLSRVAASAHTTGRAAPSP